MNDAAKIKEQMEIAHKLARTGDYEGACRIYSELKDAHPDNPFFWNMCGVLAFAMGKYMQAISYFNKALEILPEYADAAYNKARTQMFLGMTKDALFTIIPFKDASSEYKYLIGELLEKLGMKEQAVAMLASKNNADEDIIDIALKTISRDISVDMDSISEVDHVKRGLEREQALDEKLNQIFNEVDEVTEDEIKREMEKSNANTKVYEIPVKDEKSISSIIKTICKSNLVKKICSEKIPENCCYSPVVKDDDVVFLKIDAEHESITYIQKTKSGKMKRIVSYYMRVSPDATQSASASS